MSTIGLGPRPVVVPLASLAALKSDLGITDAQFDNRLETLLLDATIAVGDYINRPLFFRQREDRLTIRAFPRQTAICLGAYPVERIVSVSRNGVVWAQADIDALVIDPESGEIYRPDQSPPYWLPGRYVVTYEAGYHLPGTAPDGTPDPGTVPAAIALAVRRVAAAAYYAEGRDPALKSESEQGVGSTSWTVPDPTLGGLTPEAVGLVERYRATGIS